MHAVPYDCAPAVRLERQADDADDSSMMHERPARSARAISIAQRGYEVFRISQLEVLRNACVEALPRRITLPVSQNGGGIIRPEWPKREPRGMEQFRRANTIFVSRLRMPTARGALRVPASLLWCRHRYGVHPGQ